MPSRESAGRRGCPQRPACRHECRCAGRRRPAHRSCRERSPPLARVPTRPRRHYRVAPPAAWRGPTLVPMSSPAVQSLPPRAGSDIKPTLNSPAPGDAAPLSASRLAAGLALRPCSSCACSRDVRRRLLLPHPDRLGCALVRALQMAFGGRSSAHLCGLSPRAPPRRRARRRPRARVAQTSRCGALGPRLARGVFHQLRGRYNVGRIGAGTCVETLLADKKARRKQKTKNS